VSSLLQSPASGAALTRELIESGVDMLIPPGRRGRIDAAAVLL
jgi:hypothetical protein